MATQNNITISKMEIKIDNDVTIRYNIIHNNEVVAVGDIRYPYSKDANMTTGFVKEKFRNQGLWKLLFNLRCKWIKENTPAKYYYLFVHDKNPMKPVYERYGFEPWKTKKSNYKRFSRTKEGQLWMRKLIKK